MYKPLLGKTQYLACTLALAAVCCLPAASTWAQSVIAPNYLPDENDPFGNDQPANTTYGDTSSLLPLFPNNTNGLTPSPTPLRYQQVYNASEFSAFTGGAEIAEIAFRVGIEAPTRADAGVFSGTIPLIQITLSTTSNNASNLSTTFASNVGADAVTVYDAPLTVASTGATTTGMNGPAPFDIVIPLTSAFHYNPANGNLLLDVTETEGGEEDGSLLANAVPPVGLDGTESESSVASVYTEGDAGATTATTSTPEGLVTQFSTGALLVPEPGTTGVILGALPLFALLWLGRRRRQTVPTL